MLGRVASQRCPVFHPGKPCETCPTHAMGQSYHTARLCGEGVRLLAQETRSEANQLIYNKIIARSMLQGSRCSRKACHDSRVAFENRRPVANVRALKDLTMKRKRPASLGVNMAMAVPVLPARPVRPDLHQQSPALRHNHTSQQMASFPNSSYEGQF